MKTFLKIIFIFFIFFSIIYFYSDIIYNIKITFNLCFNSIFPSLIPFMLISNILIRYNISTEIGNLFKFLMEKIFKVNKNCSSAFFFSLLSGNPSIAKYLNDLKVKNLITNKDIAKCIKFCHFANPLFILNIGNSFLHSKTTGIILLISHYLSNFIIGIFNKKDDIKIQYENKNNNFRKEKFINVLSESIYSICDTLILILGIITTCSIFIVIVDNILNINSNFKFIYGLLEISTGVNYISISNFSITVKSIIISFLISFGGLSIHLQIFSILNNKKIRYIPYFFTRIINGILSSIITLILIQIN